MSFDKRLAFRGIRALYGNEIFEKLQNTHVTVLGVGGVGSWCAEALCRTAVGKLTLIDFDTIEITNLNRQLHTTTKTVGLYKADVLSSRLLEINPEIELEVIKSQMTPDNIDEIMKNRCDYVFCNYLFKKGSTFIVSGGAGGRIDPTLLKIGDVGTANGDALISKLRTKLKKEYGFVGSGQKFKIACTFSNEKPIYSSKEEYLSGEFPAFGASMSVTASAGLLISSWMLKQITGM